MKATGAVAALGLVGSANAETQRTTDSAVDVYGENATGSFSVSVDGETIDGWERVTIPGNRSQRMEGSDGSTEWGQPEYDDLEMERAMQPGDTALWEWRAARLEGRVADSRRTVTITLNDSGGEAVVEWAFTDAWVSEYGSLELEASDYGETATESITVTYGDVTRTQP